MSFTGTFTRFHGGPYHGLVCLSRLLNKWEAQANAFVASPELRARTLELEKLVVKHRDEPGFEATGIYPRYTGALQAEARERAANRESFIRARIKQWMFKHPEDVARLLF